VESALTDILGIPLDQPERLFPDPDKLDGDWKALLIKWHPDRVPGGARIAAHVNALRQSAKRKIAAGTWETPGLWVLHDGAKTYRMRYLRKHEFELGQLYVGNDHLVYVVRAEHIDLFRNAVNRIQGLTFAGDRMREAFQPCVPAIERERVTANACVLVIRRPPGSILLRDILEHTKGKIDPKHVAWIQNRCNYLALYLSWSGLVHGAIGPDTVWVDPANHAVALLGGWWYTAKIAERLRTLPAWSFAVAPPEIARDKLATIKLDHELIRAQGRELLGDRRGVRMEGPEPMKDFLRMPSTGDALETFRAWDEDVLTASFGPKKFVRWSLTAGQIYNKEN
jgi:hypothetical protein